MSLCHNDKKTSQLLLETWLTIMPLIEGTLHHQTSLYNYLARMELMLLKRKISLAKLTTLSCRKQQELSMTLQYLEKSLRSCYVDVQLLANYLEYMNLTLG